VPTNAEQQAEDRHGERLEHRVSGEKGERGEADGQESEELLRPELQPKLRQQRGQEDQGDDRSRSADERADGGDGQSDAGATLPRHRMPLEHCRHRGDLAGDVHQNGCDRAAVIAAVENGGEHDDGARRRQLERQWKQDDHAAGGADPRQHADQRADQAADQREHQVFRRKRDLKADDEGLKRFHLPA